MATVYANFEGNLNDIVDIVLHHGANFSSRLSSGISRIALPSLQIIGLA